MYKVDLMVQVTKFKNYIQGLLERSVVPDNTGVIHCIEHINAHLYNAVLACHAAKAQDEPLVSTAFVLKDKIHPGQKAEHQWRFEPTSSKPGRKKGLTLRYYIYSCICDNQKNIRYLCLLEN